MPGFLVAGVDFLVAGIGFLVAGVGFIVLKTYSLVSY